MRGHLSVTASAAARAAIGDIPPEITLTQGDIRSYGAYVHYFYHCAETGKAARAGGRGAVVLLNGHRISGLREIPGHPDRGDPAGRDPAGEVALRYGYMADQKVVNIVLRRFLPGTTAEASAGTSTSGGGASAAARPDCSASAATPG